MIRPGAVMRMPKFNMSSAEATALVNYFGARDGASYPYEYVEETDPSMIEKLDEQYADNGGDGTRFDSAMGIVTAQAGCVKCHVYGDYVPGGSLSGTASRAGNTAPNLANVGNRLRRDYIRPWVANPAQNFAVHADERCDPSQQSGDVGEVVQGLSRRTA